MAKFAQSRRSTEYFDKLNKNSTTGKITYRMEQWWLCAQIGLIANKQGDAPGKGSSDMVDYFIDSMKLGQGRIRGILLMRHFGNVDAGGMKRDILEREMNRMLSGNESRLSDDATHMLDRYATGGLQIIIDEIKNQTELYIFMKKYHKLVNKYCEI
jgi:hypothetical protein